MAQNSTIKGSHTSKTPMEHLEHADVVGDAVEVVAGSTIKAGSLFFSYEHEQKVTESATTAAVTVTIEVPDARDAVHGLVMPIAFYLKRNADATGAGINTFTFKDYLGGVGRIRPGGFSMNSAVEIKNSWFTCNLVSSDSDEWVVMSPSIVSAKA